MVSSTVSLNISMVRELMAKSPVPILLQFVMIYVGLLITIVSGIAMLKGQTWARLLYVGWSIIGSVVGVLTSPMKAAMIPGLVVFAVITFFLFRPKANEYFSKREIVDSAEGV